MQKKKKKNRGGQKHSFFKTSFLFREFSFLEWLHSPPPWSIFVLVYIITLYHSIIIILLYSIPLLLLLLYAISLYYHWLRK